MADNVAITAGTGTTVHADEYTHSTLGSGKTQLVKLVDGTLDSSTAIAAGGGVEAGALRVTVASDSTGVLSVDDNGGALTVDGTVTANAGTNLNTSALALEAGGNLAAIKAKTDNIPALGQALAAASVPVILPAATITTLTPPAAITGFATSANQLPDGHNVTVDNASIAVTGTFWQATQPVSGTVTAAQATAANLNMTEASAAAIKTAVETIDNAISGSEMQVDVVGALPAGTNTIGAVKSVPSDIDINGSNANHADKYYTNAGAVTDGIVWSPAAGKRWHILTLYINVSAAATVTLEDDLAGGDAARWKAELAANSGVVLTYDKEHPFCSGEDAADLIITTTAGNVYVQAVGYEV